MKGWAKSKTMHMAGVVAALGVVEASSGLLRETLAPVLGEHWAGVVMVAVGVLAAYMRTITTKPLSDK